mmetsp:Transcript_30948/g.68544  ORF Transcript_30948/g.68544 Transcript_30948/m.68544 type:complete len:838 (-) Transcript_30948:1294-3807(-)|eukprot:CAMPEP_0202897904 /NCGR_PEP_ID=MMETSP1392-20130828/6549_1 /ASSEMBLY_ACC=CAM_ASM_000868 /TAXON_ID=225041 /ORGANISM="Chlamydomonas chlamydogama, Strain SAG 11-48b" /LENGTH=837 /DNA_ID=CAMNT_0049583669 /DNA_START=57 /DNA_END=2570 /DNA_ORIENTATION=+
MERALTGLKSKLTSAKSTKDLQALKDWPTDASSYELLEDIGRGVSATVHRALCKPNHEIVAIKKMNLESMNCDLDEIIHEAQTMRNYNHPNVLSLYCSFVYGQDLWMVTPFVSGGSVLHIMKYAHPEGLDEVVIATIMREVLKALDYVHRQGGIHRDIKAGNILVDKDGSVKLGDFGVAASLERSGSWGHDKATRMTFVGTPCWMAPEVMEQTLGYDNAADIWSFGITLLEMAHGHAPFAKFPPMKVLLMTLQNPPPTLDDKGKKHFSKYMRDVVTRCLQKDPRLRPTAAQLLEHKFFKAAKDEEYLGKHLMGNMPSLGERVQDIRQGKAATTASDNDRNMARSQEEYKKGVSSWNFDVAALKAQADLEPDEDGTPLLPTITEDNEKDDMTLSGISASTAATFITSTTSGLQQQQQPSFSSDAPSTSSRPPSLSAAGAAPAGTSYVSAFATPAGQAPAASSVPAAPAAIVLPPLTVPDVPIVEGLADKGAEAGVSPSGALSPTGMSREGSVQGPLSNLVTTPTAVKHKKGRFSVYEGSDEPPPMSPAAPPSAPLAGGPTSASLTAGPLPGPSSMPGLATTSMPVVVGGIEPVQPGSVTQSTRTSDDGRREERAPSLLTESTSMAPPDETTSLEPKKKGRFTVIENSTSIPKNSSMASLSDAGKPPRNTSEAGGPKDGLLGRPPTAPSSGVPPVTVMLPKLQDLLDHAAQHHAALQKLVTAVQDSERSSKAPALLSRTQSTKSFLLDPSGSGLVGSSGPESVEELRSANDALRSRLIDMEGENIRLKARLHQLEAMMSAGGAAGSGSEGGAGQGYAAVGPSPLSPRGSSMLSIRGSEA